jgi:hypothetical protein
MKSFSVSGKLNNWEKFELECPSYLNKHVQQTGVIFKGEGGKDSTTSDIQVFKDKKYLFSIEAKYSPSQSGQFVVIEKDGYYTLSKGGKFENNQYTQAIIDFLNKNKLDYTPKGQRAIIININPDVLSGWIINHYKSKDSQFVITSTKINDYKAILPIEHIQEYFQTSAAIRRKRSGTRDVAQSNLKSCLSELEEHLDNLNLEISKVTKEPGTPLVKTLVEFNKEIEISVSNKYFGEDYFLSPNTKGKGYYLKNRAKTNNLNVIFSLEYQGPEKNIGIDLLEKYIFNRIK